MLCIEGYTYKALISIDNSKITMKKSRSSVVTICCTQKHPVNINICTTDITIAE